MATPIRPVPQGARLLRIEQVAEALQCSRTKAYELLDRPGGIPTLRVGRLRRVRVESLSEYLDRQAEQDQDR